MADGGCECGEQGGGKVVSFRRQDGATRTPGLPGSPGCRTEHGEQTDATCSAAGCRRQDTPALPTSRWVDVSGYRTRCMARCGELMRSASAWLGSLLAAPGCTWLHLSGLSTWTYGRSDAGWACLGPPARSLELTFDAPMDEQQPAAKAREAPARAGGGGAGGGAGLRAGKLSLPWQPA